MPSTSAERMRKLREKMRNDPVKYEVQKAKDRKRKAAAREKMTHTQRNDMRNKNTNAVRTHRSKKRTMAETLALTPTDEDRVPYQRTSSLSRAVQKVKQNLPQSPRKRLCVISRLVEQYPNVKTCSSKYMSETELNSTVRAFYLQDDISYQAPGRKSCVKVLVDGKLQKLQKKYVMYTLSEAHQLFTRDHPEHKISYSHFAALRPPQCQYMSCIPENVCLCVYHENIKLLLKSLQLYTVNIPKEFRPFIEKIVCNQERESCMKGHCEECQEKIATLRPIDTGNLVEYEQWVKNIKVTECGSPTQVSDKLVEQVPWFLLHTHIKRKQHQHFKHVCDQAIAKDNTVVLQIDFAENYKYIEADPTQGYHWVNKQATVFTGYVWSSNGCHSLVVVTDYMEHSKYSVGYFLKSLIIPKVKSHCPSMETLFIYSDGAASQLKSKYTLAHLNWLQEVFDININWCFFASYHGKGVVDSIGGTAKRIAHEYSKVPGNRVTNQIQFSELLIRKMRDTWVFTTNGECIEEYKNQFSEKFSDPASVSGIKQSHMFMGSRGDTSKTMVGVHYGASAPLSTHVWVTKAGTNQSVETTPSNDTNERKIKEGEMIAIAYEDGYDIGEVVKVICPTEFRVKMMERAGDKFKWPSSTKNRQVHKNFLLAVRPILSPANSSLRLFVLDNNKCVSNDYSEFKKKYFDV